ncbi:T9SS type A sorting domain-containing protein [Flaviaesturariibacter flavus]|uniref:T9SS type A sorting domain-containing protein n=1 Tax=Flaviaesturariibacter flavus TaxID=2502780 RepID=A0A4R1BMY2_9BACT|nr:M14 family zinc carboxypeptidase [Flaviaesturariibacter flavus]TCJ18824.1 T9SS type A sorting domain-containing protein [Flaviaesturariibacter flavus]
MRKTLFLMLSLCVFFVLSSHAQDKYSKVRIPMKSPDVKAFVFDNLEIDHYQMNNGAMEVVLDQEELARLRASGFRYTVLVDDVVRYTTELNRRIGANWSRYETAKAPYAVSCSNAAGIFTTPTSFGNGGSLRLGAATGTGYFTYAEMISEMQALVAAYPNLVSLYSIGKTINNNDIWGVKISDNVATDESEPEVLFTGIQHAREAIGGTSLIFFMEYLCESYSTDAKIKELVDSREIFIIPCVNVDGYMYNYSGASGYPTTGGGLWRKNRRLISGSTYGVDINRNYSVDWGNCAGASTSCGSNTASQDTYYGPSAFSEKETQAIRAFVSAHKFVTAIDQHCYGPYYSLPFGRPSLHTMSASDANFYTAIPALMGAYNCHRAGNSPETVNYEVAGGIKDWLLMGDIGLGTKGKIYGMTGEAGGGDFWAPISQIKTLCQQNCMQNIQLSYAAGQYYDIQDMNDVALTSKTGTLSFQLRNIGLTSGPATVTLVPVENMVNAGASVATELTAYYDTYTGSVSYTLPGNIAAGYRVRYNWVVSAGGVTYVDSVTKLYNPVTMLSDDMEGNITTNWTTASNVAGNGGSWAYTNSSAFGGSNSLTESPSGNYTTSTTRTITYKNTLDLSDATNSYLTFWVKHRSENCRDKLQVQVNTTGNNNSWVAVCGSHTIAEATATGSGSLGGNPALTGIRDQWTRVWYDLTSYAGQPGLNLRLQFTSDADADAFAHELDDGFYIDNLKVVKTTQTFNVLPVRFVNFKGQLQPNGTVRLHWEAYTDEQHDHFEIERSADGVRFETIGRLSTPPPYIYFDAQPLAGANHYRIRQVDHNGHATYSNIVLIHLGLQVQLQVYPNPATDRLQVQLQCTQPGLLQLRLNDLQGRPLWQQSTVAGRSASSLQVPLFGMASGTYVLQVRDAEGRLLSTQRVVKL